MKTSSDPRHLKRVTQVSKLYASSFVTGFSTPNDKLISTAAPDWPLAKINKIDLAILRVAVEELLHTKTPPKVVIDEAVEIAKKYGAEQSPSFVNGVLGTILKTQHII